MNGLTAALLDARNRVDFAVSRLLTWSPAARERPEPMDDLFGDLEPAERTEAEEQERALRTTFHLDDLRGRATRSRYRRNLSVLHSLDAGLGDLPGDALPDRVRALDVGAKNFDYVDALVAFAAWHGRTGTPREVALTGVEVDAHRRYADLRTRRAWAEHYAAQVPGSRFVVGDVREVEGSYDLVTWFHPFVTLEPLLRWGLPRSLLAPQDLLSHVISLLAPGGWLLVVSYDEEEAVEQRRLLDAGHLVWEDRGAPPATALCRGRERRLTRYRRPPAGTRPTLRILDGVRGRP